MSDKNEKRKPAHVVILDKLRNIVPKLPPMSTSHGTEVLMNAIDALPELTVAITLCDILNKMDIPKEAVSETIKTLGELQFSNTKCATVHLRLAKVKRNLIKERLS